MKVEHILYEAVHSALITQIHRGYYKTGEYLPSFNALCEEFDVSNITVRKAVHMLVEEGYVIPLKSKRFQVTFDIQDPNSAQEYLGQLIVRKQAIEETFDAIARLLPALNMAGAGYCGEEALAALSRITVSIDPWTQSLSQICDSLNAFHTRVIAELRNQAILDLTRQMGSFVTISYMPAFDLPHPLGTQFINGRHYLRRIEELIRAKRCTELRSRLKSSYRAGCDSVTEYIEAVTLLARAEKPVPFTWRLVGHDPCPQMALVDEILCAVVAGELAPGQMLPPPPVYAERFGISDFYVRRTLAFLGSVGITKTINGRGTQLLQEPFPIVPCMEYPELRRMLRRLLEALQLVSLTCADVIREAIRWAPGELPADFSWSAPFPARAILAWVTEQIENGTLREIYRQVTQVMLFGHLVTHGNLRPEGAFDTHRECAAALALLRAGDREEFAGQVQRLFTKLHRLSWQWLRDRNMPEEELTRL